MDILICTHEKDTSIIFDTVKAYFARKFQDEAFTWERSGTTLKTSLQAGEKEVTEVFEKLVERFPELELEASFSYDVREDDRSAQWWGITRIYSQRENGETKIVSSSSTYWN